MVYAFLAIEFYPVFLDLRLTATRLLEQGRNDVMIF